MSREEKIWYYKGEDGTIYGPHTSQDMMRWFMMGYFNENLLLRRKDDRKYSTLRDMVEQCNGVVPFANPSNGGGGIAAVSPMHHGMITGGISPQQAMMFAGGATGAPGGLAAPRPSGGPTTGSTAVLMAATPNGYVPYVMSQNGHPTPHPAFMVPTYAAAAAYYAAQGGTAASSTNAFLSSRTTTPDVEGTSASGSPSGAYPPYAPGSDGVPSEEPSEPLSADANLDVTLGDNKSTMNGDAAIIKVGQHCQTEAELGVRHRGAAHRCVHAAVAMPPQQETQSTQTTVVCYGDTWSQTDYTTYEDKAVMTDRAEIDLLELNALLDRFGFQVVAKK